MAGDGDALSAHPGGGPFNTARTLGRLEQPVAFLGRLSTDAFGRRLEAMLAADSVRLDAVVRTDEPTTLAMAELDSGGGARYRFYERGTSAPGLTPDAALRALPEHVEVVHVGTLGIALEPIASALEAVVEQLAPRAMVALDPNCRPWAIPDPAAYRDRLDRLLTRTHLVKVSEEDLGWLEPGRAVVEAARVVLAKGPALVVVTRGPEGAVAVTGETEVAVPAPPVEVADTIGAGDAFGGGFLAWWRSRGLGREQLGDIGAAEDATAYACRVAALTCGRPGASPPRLSELTR